MPPAPLTDAQKAELADLMLALGHNPKSRKEVAKLIRAHADDPRVKAFVPSFADVKDDPAAADPDDRPMTRKELKAALAEDEGVRREESEKRERAGQRQRLVESGRFTEEAMKGLDTFMQEHGYSNYDHAAVIYAHENPPANARPTIGNEKTWQMPGDAEWRKDPKKRALQEAYKVVDELRGTRRA